MNHRCLLVFSRKHNSTGNHLFFWLFFYPITWFLIISLFMGIFLNDSLIRNVDKFQIIIVFLFVSLRNLIVSVKYGYYRGEDYEQLSKDPPHWDEFKTNRRLVGQGWSNPSKYPSLIEDEAEGELLRLVELKTMIDALPSTVDSLVRQGRVGTATGRIMKLLTMANAHFQANQPWADKTGTAGGRRSEKTLADTLSTDKRRGEVTRCLHSRTGLIAPSVRRAELHVAGQHVVSHSIYNGQRQLRSASVLEEDLPCLLHHRQCRELRPDCLPQFL